MTFAMPEKQKCIVQDGTNSRRQGESLHALIQNKYLQHGQFKHSVTGAV